MNELQYVIREIVDGNSFYICSGLIERTTILSHAGRWPYDHAKEIVEGNKRFMMIEYSKSHAVIQN